MNLLDIKNYLMRVKMTSLATLCSYFNCDAELARQMLGHWIRKGKVRQCKKTVNCGVKCMQCSPSMTEMYEWCATDLDPRFPSPAITIIFLMITFWRAREIGD